MPIFAVFLRESGIVPFMETLWQNVPVGLDVAPLQSLAQDTSLTILYSLLTEFQKELTTQRQIAASAVQATDIRGLGTAFHTTKGLAATFGLKELKRASETLEQQLASMSDDDLFAMQTTFAHQLDQAERLLAEFLPLVKEHL
ncbi:MAG: Hpt domain-containing protein [Alphaproteobacteria bacterium]|nr:MAG: Hpt domain-containing protein [Alphaproteobacteria bacterium]